MKKLTILAVLACLLSIAATATAGTSKYKGDIDPSGRLSFKLEKKSGKERVVGLQWAALPVDCDGKAQTTGGSLTFKVPVKGGAFRAQAVLGDADNPDAKADIRGQFTGRTAAGTIAVSGRNLPVDNGNDADCRSGKLSWTATR